MLEFKRPEPAPEKLPPPRWDIGVDKKRVGAYIGAALAGGLLLGFIFARMGRTEQKPQPAIEDSAAEQTANTRPPSREPASGAFHKVTRIIRADTIEVEDVGVVRMIGVETPDGKQPSESYARHGQNALDYTQKMAMDQEVRLEFDSLNASHGHKDEQNQTLAYVYTRDGLQINSELVRLGLAFVRGLEQFTASDDFRMLERDAVQNSRGVWGPSSGATAAAIKPAPSTSSATSSSSSSGSSTKEKPRKIEPLSPSALGANIPALTNPSSSSATSSEASVYVSNADHMYHKAGCELLDKKRKRPIGLSEARAQGYSACSRCYASTVLKAP